MDNIIDFDVNFEHEKKILCDKFISEVKETIESGYSFGEYLFETYDDDFFSSPGFYYLAFVLFTFLIMFKISLSSLYK